MLCRTQFDKTKKEIKKEIPDFLSFLSFSLWEERISTQAQAKSQLQSDDSSTLRSTPKTR